MPVALPFLTTMVATHVFARWKAVCEAAQADGTRAVELAERYGEPAEDGVRITLLISQRELVGWVGSSREAVNKALRQFEHRRLIAAERRHLIVLDLDGLRGRVS